MIFRSSSLPAASIQRVDIVEGKSLSLVIQPKPRLAFLGFEGTDEFAGRERILSMLQELGAATQGGGLPAPPAQ